LLSGEVRVERVAAEAHQRSVANFFSWMSRVTLTVIIATGILSVSCRRSSEPTFVQRTSPSPTATHSAPTALAKDFESTGIAHGSGDDYRRRSNGAYLRYGCADRSSEEAALELVRNERIGHLIGKTDVLADNGAKIGERVVWDAVKGGDAEVKWNERARLFYIQTPLLKDALDFEKSNFWVRIGCRDFRGF
jgi:hypothetical protein